MALRFNCRTRPNHRDEKNTLATQLWFTNIDNCCSWMVGSVPTVQKFSSDPHSPCPTDRVNSTCLFRESQEIFLLTNHVEMSAQHFKRLIFIASISQPQQFKDVWTLCPQIPQKVYYANSTNDGLFNKSWLNRSLLQTKDECRQKVWKTEEEFSYPLSTGNLNIDSGPTSIGLELMTARLKYLFFLSLEEGFARLGQITVFFDKSNCAGQRAV